MNARVRRDLSSLMCRTSRRCRQIDDVLFVDMKISERDWVVSKMYPKELELKEVCRLSCRALVS